MIFDIDILNDIESSINKFVKEHPFDITIVVPSENPLNDYIANKILSKSPNAELIEGVVRKLTTEEVDDIVLNDMNCAFRQYYDDDFSDAYNQLADYLDKMDIEKNGKFSRHYILDSTMRDVLDTTIKICDENYTRHAKKITDRNILIIDDTISRGQSIKEICKLINDTYAPKSITVLTLLSKLN